MSGERRLADGQWHRLHPLSPWLRGGFVILAVLGWVLGQARDEILQMLLSPLLPRAPERSRDSGGSPGVLRSLLGEAAVPVVLILIGAVAFALVLLWWLLSWRLSSFRVTDEFVEARNGVLDRTYRQARLDRVQSIDVSRPFVARLFGLAELHVDVASLDGNINLRYLPARAASMLRDDILRLASGARDALAQSEPEAQAPGHAADAVRGRGLSALIEERIASFQEEPAEGVPQSSFVRISVARLVLVGLVDCAVVLAWLLVFFGLACALGLGAVVITGSFAEAPVIFGILLPVFAISLAGIFVPIAFASITGRVMPNARYSIIGTPDGVRITRGLLSVVTEVLPPGRVHALELSQPLLWRPFGWWKLCVTRAGQGGGSEGGRGRQPTGGVIMPVASFEDALRVVTLLMPMHMSGAVEQAIRSGSDAQLAAGSPYTRAPRGGALVQPFSFRRAGLALVDGVLLSRRGLAVRRISMAPAERLQSVALTAGPRQRLAGVATVQAGLVPGPVRVFSPVIASEEAHVLFSQIREVAIEAAAHDTSHRWREAAALGAVKAAGARLADAQRAGITPDPRDLALVDAMREYREQSASVPGGTGDLL